MNDLEATAQEFDLELGRLKSRQQMILSSSPYLQRITPYLQRMRPVKALVRSGP